MFTLQGAQSFTPPGGCHTPARTSEEPEVLPFTTAKLISQQRGGYYVSQNQLTAIESWSMRFSGGHHIA